MESKIREAVDAALQKRKSEQSRLISYCYENATALSDELKKRDISHRIEYVGIVEDLLQLTDCSVDDFREATENGTYGEGVPETKDELFDEANHYIVVVESSDRELVAEICAEHRGHFRETYIGEWSSDQYLRLRDGTVSEY